MKTSTPPPATHLTPRIGVSRCLLGHEVRVNGGHCQDRWVRNILAKSSELVGVCPEVEIGQPTPRPPMRLALTEASQDNDDIRLIESKSGVEWTDKMASFAATRVDELAALNLDGFILKKDSPTCGVFRVKVYDRNSSPTRRGRGFFADALMKRLPNLPVEEDGRLNDPALRESFLTRIHVHAAWQRFLREDGSLHGFGEFHARHKMLLLASDPGAYRRLGRLVAGHEDGSREPGARFASYEAGLMEALTKTVSRGRHINVLQHLLGFCKKKMAPAEKVELGRLLGLYAEGAVARAAPVSLVRFLLLKNEAAAWASEQVYLEPYPPQLEPTPNA